MILDLLPRIRDRIDNLPKHIIVGIILVAVSIGSVTVNSNVAEESISVKLKTIPLTIPEILAVAETPHAPKFDQSRWQYESFDEEVECLALNIYFEGRDQDMAGQLAIGLVTINRVLSRKHPNSICDVVWKKKKVKSGRYVAQFSWTWDGKVDTPKEAAAWLKSKQVAAGMLAGRSLFNVVDFTKGSTHYHAHYVDPSWNKSLNPSITVGDHLFYSPLPVAKAQANML